MRTKCIGTRTLAVSFTIRDGDMYATVWSRGAVVGILNAPTSNDIHLFKENKDIHVLVNGSSIWVKAKYL